MKYHITIRGTSDLLMDNGTRSIDPDHPLVMERAELTKQKSKTKETRAEIARLSVLVSIWGNETPGDPIEIPAAAFRAALEGGARKFKEGPDVREGVTVEACTRFTHRFAEHDIDGLSRRQWNDPEGGLQFTVGVVQQRARILRTRSRFQEWEATFQVDIDAGIVKQSDLKKWIKAAGTRIGIGGWRPQKSGSFGRFELQDIKKTK